MKWWDRMLWSSFSECWAYFHASWGSVCVPTELCSMLCGSLEGREVWGRMDTRTCVAKSLCCPPETITLFISYTPTQNKKFKKSVCVSKWRTWPIEYIWTGKLLIEFFEMSLGIVYSWIFWRTFYFNSSWDSPYCLSWAVPLLSSPISFSFALFSMFHRTQHFSHCGLFSINLFCIWLTCFGQPFMSQFFDCLEYAVTPSPLVENSSDLKGIHSTWVQNCLEHW